MLASDLSQWGIPTGVAAMITTVGASAWKYATDRAARKAKEQVEERKEREALLASERQYTASTQERVDQKMTDLLDRLAKDAKEQGAALERLRDKYELLERENSEQRAAIAVYIFELASLRSQNLDLTNQLTAVRLAEVNRRAERDKQE